MSDNKPDDEAAPPQEAEKPALDPPPIKPGRTQDTGMRVQAPDILDDDTLPITNRE
jgi:hypothetical protein